MNTQSKFAQNSEQITIQKQLDLPPKRTVIIAEAVGVAYPGNKDLPK